MSLVYWAVPKNYLRGGGKYPQNKLDDCHSYLPIIYFPLSIKKEKKSHQIFL